MKTPPWPVLILVAILSLAIIGAVVMAIWNLVMVKVFPVPELTWIDATFLWVLVRLFLTSPPTKTGAANMKTKTCPVCKGAKTIEVPIGKADTRGTVYRAISPCPTCDGNGIITKE